MNVTTPIALSRPASAPFSEAEWTARVNLAACYRLVDLYGMSDMAANHISMRVPDEDEAFLINPYGLLYNQVTASSLLKVDLAGNILYNPWDDFGINVAGYVIHSAVHEARPEVECVIHTHTADGMAVSALECGLLPLTQTSMRFATVAMHEYEGVAVDDEEKKRLVADLGDAEAMILRNHGLLVTGTTVATAFNNIYRLELACRLQIKAMSCNTPLHMPAPAVIAHTKAQLVTQVAASGKVKRAHGVLEWPALLKNLDACDPSYKT